MTEPSDELLGKLSRRNWIILAILLLLSLPWRSRDITLGVLSGGMIAIIGYRWLYRSLRQVLETPGPGSARSFRFGYMVRLAALSASLFALLVVARVNPFGLIAGLSVVVINIFWTVLKGPLSRGGSSKS